MRVTLCQQVEGKEPGDTVTVDADRGQWLVDNGYATNAGGDDDQDDDGRPAKSASKAEWVDYAVSQGANQDDADGMTKAELQEQYG